MHNDTTPSPAELLAEIDSLRTELARAREAEAQYRRERDAAQEETLLVAAISQCVPGVFYVIDESGRLLRWNRGLEQVTGYSSDEVARMKRADFLDSSDDARIARMILESGDAGQGQTEAHLVTKDQRRIPYLFVGRCYRFDDSRRVAGLGIRFDAGAAGEQTQQQRARAEQKVSLLTPRQVEVLRNVVAGKTNKAIATQLQISEKTVEKHRFNIVRRLDVKSTAELVRLAVLAGLGPSSAESSPPFRAE